MHSSLAQGTIYFIDSIPGIQFIPREKMRPRDFRGNIYPCISGSDSVSQTFFSSSLYKSGLHVVTNRETSVLLDSTEHIASFQYSYEPEDRGSRRIQENALYPDSTQILFSEIRFDSLNKESCFFSFRESNFCLKCDFGWRWRLRKSRLTRWICSCGRSRKSYSLVVPVDHFRGVFK